LPVGTAATGSPPSGATSSRPWQSGTAAPTTTRHTADEGTPEDALTADHDPARPSPGPGLDLEVLPETLVICRLPPGAPIPGWAVEAEQFVTISRTLEELSITAAQSAVPDGVRCERDYRAFRVRGTLPMHLVGILSRIAVPLAEAGVSIFAISTFDTDYVLVKSADLERAAAALSGAGHRVAGG
jgi:hypothetical protein